MGAAILSRLSLLPSSVVALPRRKWRSPGPVPTQLTHRPPAASLRLWPASGAGGEKPPAQCPTSAPPALKPQLWEPPSWDRAASPPSAPPLPKRAPRAGESGRAGHSWNELRLSRERVGGGDSAVRLLSCRTAPSVCLYRSGSRHLETSSSVPPILFLLGQFIHHRPKARQRPILTSLLITPSHRNRPQVPELGPEVATVRQKER